MTIRSFIVASVVLAAQVANAEPSPICKGLEEAACNSKQLANVSVCKWIGPRLTATKEVKGYCRASTKSVTKEQFEAIQSEIKKTAAQ